MNHRELCREASRWLLDQTRIDLVSFEIGWKNSVFDAVGITLPNKNVVEPRICIIEVKRTRTDLLADLRAKKMLKYEPHASHCYLALGPDFNTSILQELPALGLPPHWGVILFQGSEFKSIRAARSIRKVTQSELSTLTKKIALSYMHRVLSYNSPMEV